MKQVPGVPNSAGTRMTAVALVRLQSRKSGVTATEQIRTRAVSMAHSFTALDAAPGTHVHRVCDPGHTLRARSCCAVQQYACQGRRRRSFGPRAGKRAAQEPACRRAVQGGGLRQAAAWAKVPSNWAGAADACGMCFSRHFGPG